MKCEFYARGVELTHRRWQGVLNGRVPQTGLSSITSWELFDAVIQCRSVNTVKLTRAYIYARVHASSVSVHVRPCSRMLFVIIYEEPRGHQGEAYVGRLRSGRATSYVLTTPVTTLLSQRHNIVTR